MSSKVHRRVKRRRRETGAVQILEEAFHLVRVADAGGFWIYYLGAVPWALGLLYFIADMSRSSLADRDAAFAALAMTGLWLWMRYCRAEFSARLWARLHPGHLPVKGASRRFRALAALWFAHAFRIPLLAVGIFFAVPLGWIVATLQNFTVLALTQDPGDRPLRSLVGRSIRYSHDQWAQNHGILLIFLFVALFTWINLLSTCLVVPSFAKSFFGIESLFTISPEAAMGNTTFLLGIFLLLQLVLDPLLLATYVLRCFYAGSRTTGADLLGRLAACREKHEEEGRRERGTLGRVALPALFAVSTALAAPTAAQEPPAAPPPAAQGAVDADLFRKEIAETLEQKKYQWRLSRRLDGSVPTAEESWLGRRLGEISSSAKRHIRAFGDWFEEMMRRLLERERRGGAKGMEEETGFFRGLGSTMSVALVAVVLGLLLWFAFAMYRRYRGREKAEIPDEGRGGPIDLASEDIVATQLREDEWLRLAREQIERGDERLAIRALFLATLAHLGEEGLLKIARSKSNRDYRGELGLRARALAGLRRAFDENTTLFERVWYGPHRPGPGGVEGYLENHRVIAEESAKARIRPAGSGAVPTL